MECQSFPHSKATLYRNGRNFTSKPFLSWPNTPLATPTPMTNTVISFPTASTSSFTVHCSGRIWDEVLSTSSACDVLGVTSDCSPAQLKAAFRSKVKKFHPDVGKGGEPSDVMIRRVILAYQILSRYSKTEIIERECLDPFEEPECEAFDVFVNEVLCVGKGCPYSCVDRAPHAFGFSLSTGTARATSQGHQDDYRVQLAVGQCPRSCIHYVTPSQRVILEELLDSRAEETQNQKKPDKQLRTVKIMRSINVEHYWTSKKMSFNRLSCVLI